MEEKENKELNLIFVDKGATAEDLRLVQSSLRARSNGEKEIDNEVVYYEDFLTVGDDVVENTEKVVDMVATADRVVVINPVDPITGRGTLSDGARDLMAAIQDNKAVYYLNTTIDFVSTNDWTIAIKGKLDGIQSGHVASSTALQRRRAQLENPNESRVK